jgi:hypothetical protein
MIPALSGGVYPMFFCFRRITRHFQEKAGPCQAVFLCQPCSRLPTNGRHRQPSSLFILERFLVQLSIQLIADQREAHNAAIPKFSNHRLALLPSALFVEQLLRCQLGVLNWKRVLPSRTRTECRCFQRRSFLARPAVTRTRRFD